MVESITAVQGSTGLVKGRWISYEDTEIGFFEKMDQVNILRLLHARVLEKFRKRETMGVVGNVAADGEGLL